MLTEQVLALLSLAAAVAVSGTRPARLRLGPAGDPARRNRFARRPPLPLVFGLSTGALVATIAGLPAGVAVAVGGGYAVHRYRRRGWRPGGPAKQLDLAAGWDLLAACLRAGLPVPTAIRAVADDLPRAAAGALRATADLLALGADPVDAWTPALDCPATAALARAARRTARSGTALAGVASALATDIRAAACDVAESRAQRAGVLITGPLGLCFLPAFVCLGIAPVVVGLATQLSVHQ